MHIRATIVVFALISCLSVIAGLSWLYPLETVVAPIVPEQIEYRIVAEYPHDVRAFTQGLVFEEGRFYEGTGMWGESDIRMVDVESGVVLSEQPLGAELFGEGITIVGDRLIQLTWQAGRGFVYDKSNFELLADFQYSGEGWGLTFDGTHLIMSDGTAELRFLSPTDFSEVRRVTVLQAGEPLANLNELEFIDGSVFANVWKTDEIVRISPQTGIVTGILDLSGILDESEKSEVTDVLNGIAYDAASDIVYVTGKYWPKVFVLRLDAN